MGLKGGGRRGKEEQGKVRTGDQIPPCPGQIKARFRAPNTLCTGSIEVRFRAHPKDRGIFSPIRD